MLDRSLRFQSPRRSGSREQQAVPVGIAHERAGVKTRRVGSERDGTGRDPTAARSARRASEAAGIVYVEPHVPVREIVRRYVGLRRPAFRWGEILEKLQTAACNARRWRAMQAGYRQAFPE